MELLGQFLSDNIGTEALPHTGAQIFISEGTKIRKKKKQQIVWQGDSTTDVYYIYSGIAEVSLLSPNTKELIFREIPSGHMFGELSSIDGGTRSVTVEASEDCELYKLSGESFLSLVLENDELRHWLHLLLVGRIRNLTDKVFELSTMSVPCRIWLDLVRRAQQAGIANDQALLKGMPSHKKLANYLGTHREAVAREFSQLTSDGIIQKLPEKTIKIFSISKLEKLIARMMGD